MALLSTKADFSSERQLHAELHLPRLLRTEDAAEVWRSEDAVRHVEICAVEEVEDFPARFELPATNTPHTGESDVRRAEARNDAAVERSAAKGKCHEQRERHCVK